MIIGLSVVKKRADGGEETRTIMEKSDRGNV